MTPALAIILRRPRSGDRRLGECDRAALHAGLALGRQLGCEVEALALGGNRENAALELALRAGCTRAARIDDRGARRIDYLATGRALAIALRRAPLGLVIIGDRSSDNHGGGVGPALAHWLEVPHVTSVVAAEVKGGAVEATRRAGGELHRFRVPVPAVLCIASFEPVALIRGLRGRRPRHIDLATLDLERDELEARARGATPPTRRLPARAELFADPAGLVVRLVGDALVTVPPPPGATPTVAPPAEVARTTDPARSTGPGPVTG